MRVVDALWSSNVTPQQLIRMMGATRGRQNIQRVLQGRIPQLQHAEAQTGAQLLGEYLYHITVADPSGEFAMNSLLEPVVAPDILGVYARLPLQHEFERLEETRDMALRKAIVLFGSQDWMRPNEPSARKALSNLNTIDASVHVVENSGHHLYLDNANEFVRHIVSS
ncbi:MAG: hypothetical protein SGILL_000201 [Bacillariaceae sp.]